MKIKFSSICGVYDCSGAGVHYKIMQREEGAGERVFGKAHEQPFVDRITAQLRPAPHALSGCSDNRVISKHCFWHPHVCSGDQYKPFEPKKNPLA